MGCGLWSGAGDSVLHKACLRTARPAMASDAPRRTRGGRRGPCERLPTGGRSSVRLHLRPNVPCLLCQVGVILHLMLLPLVLNGPEVQHGPALTRHGSASPRGVQGRQGPRAVSSPLPGACCGLSMGTHLSLKCLWIWGGPVSSSDVSFVTENTTCRMSGGHVGLCFCLSLLRPWEERNGMPPLVLAGVPTLQAVGEDTC